MSVVRRHRFISRACRWKVRGNIACEAAWRQGLSALGPVRMQASPEECCRAPQTCGLKCRAVQLLHIRSLLRFRAIRMSLPIFARRARANGSLWLQVLTGIHRRRLTMKMNHRRSGSNAASGCWLAVACAAIGLTSTGVRAGEDPFVASPIVAPFEMRQLDAAGSGDLVSPVYLQNIVNPADKMASRSRDSATRPTDDPRRPENPFANRMSSYEMPAVEVVGEKLPELREEDKIGPYAQPRWTARRFTPRHPRVCAPAGHHRVRILASPHHRQRRQHRNSHAVRSRHRPAVPLPD